MSAHRSQLAALILTRRVIKLTCQLATILLIVGGLAIGDAYHIAGMLLFISGLVAPVLLVGYALRRSPSRVLLLRPFGESGVSQSLKGLARRHLSPLGPTFTLADDDLTPPGPLYSLLTGYLRFGGFLTNWMLPARWSAEDRAGLDQLAHALQGTTKFALAWLWSSNGLFVIRASDRLWKEAVALLMTRADLIVVDLSESGPGSVWELDQIRTVNFSKRVVCVALQGRLGVAQDLVSKLLPRGFGDRFFGYCADGSILRKEEFLKLVSGIVYSRK